MSDGVVEAYLGGGAYLGRAHIRGTEQERLFQEARRTFRNVLYHFFALPAAQAKGEPSSAYASLCNLLTYMHATPLPPHILWAF